MKKKLFAWLGGSLLASKEHQIELLTTALRNAQEKAADIQSKFNDLAIQECKTCTALKQIINYQALCAGSRAGVFEGLGPSLPEPKPVDLSKLTQSSLRGRKAAQAANQEFQEKTLPKMMEEDNDWFGQLRTAAEAELELERQKGTA